MVVLKGSRFIRPRRAGRPVCRRPAWLWARVSESLDHNDSTRTFRGVTYREFDHTVRFEVTVVCVEYERWFFQVKIFRVETSRDNS